MDLRKKAVLWDSH